MNSNDPFGITDPTIHRTCLTGSTYDTSVVSGIFHLEGDSSLSSPERHTWQRTCVPQDRTLEAPTRAAHCATPNTEHRKSPNRSFENNPFGPASRSITVPDWCD